MERDPGNMVDRYTISILKGDIQEENRYFKELHLLDKQYPQVAWSAEVRDLLEVNRKIWELEATIGRTALEIRGLNNRRIELKNHINELTGNPTKEIKKDHASV